MQGKFRLLFHFLCRGDLEKQHGYKKRAIKEGLKAKSIGFLKLG